MTQLISADWHLTNKQRDSYRWDLFEKLKQIIQINKVDQLIFLGDLTEEKDNHNSVLVNKIVKEFIDLSLLCTEGIFFLQGNHDYSNTQQSYWEFLTAIPRVHYIKKSCYIEECKAYFLPYGQKLNNQIKQTDVLFMHDLVIGANYQNYFVKKGLKISDLPSITISGHIHKPQDILKRRGKISYVGAPYSIDYGDHYNSRILIRHVNENLFQNISLRSVTKWSIKIKKIEDLYQNYNFSPGDYVKIGLRTRTMNIDTVKKQIIDYLEKQEIIFAGFTIEKVIDTSIKKIVTKQSNLSVFQEHCKNKQLEEDLINQAFQFME